MFIIQIKDEFCRPLGTVKVGFTEQSPAVFAEILPSERGLTSQEARAFGDAFCSAARAAERIVREGKRRVP